MRKNENGAWQGVWVGVMLCCMVLLLGACKGGGGAGGGRDESQEEIKGPEASWDEKEVGFFVNNAEGITQLEVNDGVFYLRLECRARAAGLYSGVVSGGELRCKSESVTGTGGTEHRYTVHSGVWEQSVGGDASCISGLRFEMTGQDNERGEAVGIRLLGMDLRVLDTGGDAERSGSVERVERIEVDGKEMQSPRAGASFYLRHE